MSNHVFMFQDRFANGVKNGTKPNTIRLKRKRMPKVGDTVSLRAWTGKPYRSKQIVLRESVVEAVAQISIRRTTQPIFITHHSTKMAHFPDADAFARADGFEDADDMLNWFEAQHGLPFRGFLTAWRVEGGAQ